MAEWVATRHPLDGCKFYLQETTNRATWRHPTFEDPYAVVRELEEPDEVKVSAKDSSTQVEVSRYSHAPDVSFESPSRHGKYESQPKAQQTSQAVDAPETFSGVASASAVIEEVKMLVAQIQKGAHGVQGGPESLQPFPTVEGMASLKSELKSLVHHNLCQKSDIELLLWRINSISKSPNSAPKDVPDRSGNRRGDLGRGKSDRQSYDSSANDLGRGAVTRVKPGDQPFRLEKCELSALPSFVSDYLQPLKDLVTLLRDRPVTMSTLGQLVEGDGEARTQLALFVSRVLYDYTSIESTQLVAVMRNTIIDHFAALARDFSSSKAVIDEISHQVANGIPRTLWTDSFLEAMFQAFADREDCIAYVRSVVSRFIKSIRAKDSVSAYATRSQLGSALSRQTTTKMAAIASEALHDVFTQPETRQSCPEDLIRISHHLYVSAERWHPGTGGLTFNAFVIGSVFLPSFRHPDLHGAVDSEELSDRVVQYFGIAADLLKHYAYGLPFPSWMNGAPPREVSDMLRAMNQYRSVILSWTLPQPEHFHPLYRSSISITIHELDHLVHQLQAHKDIVCPSRRTPLHKTLSQLPDFLRVEPDRDLLFVLDLADSQYFPSHGVIDPEECLLIRSNLEEAHDIMSTQVALQFQSDNSAGFSDVANRLQSVRDILTLHKDTASIWFQEALAVRKALAKAQTNQLHLANIHRKCKLEYQRSLFSNLSQRDPAASNRNSSRSNVSNLPSFSDLAHSLNQSTASTINRSNYSPHVSHSPPAPSASHFGLMSGVRAHPVHHVGRLGDMENPNHFPSVQASTPLREALVRPTPAGSATSGHYSFVPQSPLAKLLETQYR